jgi:acetoin utilization protein AcuB
MQIFNWMTPNPTCVRPQDTLEKAKELMMAGGFRRLLVVEGDKHLVGMISERDVRQHLGYLADTKVNAAMASSPVSIPEFESAESAPKLMLQHKIGGIPVIKMTGGSWVS